MSAVRLLTADDAERALDLAGEAFGYTLGPEESPPPIPRPGRHEWGAFDGDTLVTRVAVLELASWWGGVEVPTAGVAGVTVAAEARGSGRLEAPMRAALAEARARGDVLAALYPTAPGIYRRFGFETVTSLLDVDLPTAQLPAGRPDGVLLRRAGAADVEVVRSLYDQWARAQDGPLTRRTPTFGSPLDGPLVTLAEIDGTALGFVAWHRGPGYDASSRLTVDDLNGLDPRATAALWSFLAGWASVAPTVRLSTSGHDLARLSLRADAGRVVRDRPYMLRLLDVAGALSRRPAAVDGSAPFAVAADALDGPASYVMESAGGLIAVESGSGDGPTFTSRGLALWFAGVQTLATLRRAGLVTGSTTHDALLDRLLTHRPVHIRDYF